MSTRSAIAIKHEDGTIESVYCHFDGYPEHNGNILLNEYTNKSKIVQLLSNGSISSLGPEIGEKHDFMDRSNERWCTFYHRDREEKLEEAVIFSKITEWWDYYPYCDYYYMFDENSSTWKCYDYDRKPVNLYAVLDE